MEEDNSIAALSVSGLSKTYEGGLQALKGISFQVNQGDRFALLGPNGAGKSTAIGMITSLVNKTAGTVKVHGHDVDNDVLLAKTFMGVVPQEINLNMFETPWNTLMYQAAYYGLTRKEVKGRAEELLRQMNLWEKKDTQVRGLSGGMKRRLMIARGLIHNPKLLILDEPTAGVDVEIRKSMWSFLEALNAKGLTIVLTTHYLEEAEQLCNRVAIINKGELLEDTTTVDLLKKLDTESLVLYLGAPCMNCPELKWPTKLVDPQTLEIEIKASDNLNDVFVALSELGMEVKSMRNKANRLEQMFMKVVDASEGEKEEA